MLTFTDQMGRQVAIAAPPRRIVSLVPSQTELLFDLGLYDRIVGITKFCIHPAEAVKGKTIIGGTKRFRIDVIHRLQPDLIIGNKEENDKEGIEELARHYPVWISNVYTLDDSLAMIRAIGKLTQTEAKAATIAKEVETGFAALTTYQTAQRVLYLIWRKPWMAAGKQTFINEILQRGGWQNAVTASRYPELSEADIRALSPDLVFLSSEPFPFGDKHIAELQQILPHAQILLVDGELFSWYGSRLRHSAAYLAELRGQLG
jgi:ABC-type Fe3+-hydroxamate transport system substrate-binding protein